MEDESCDARKQAPARRVLESAFIANPALEPERSDSVFREIPDNIDRQVGMHDDPTVHSNSKTRGRFGFQSLSPGGICVGDKNIDADINSPDSHTVDNVKDI